MSNDKDNHDAFLDKRLKIRMIGYHLERDIMSLILPALFNIFPQMSIATEV
jgi:hypothetical protein